MNTMKILATLTFFCATFVYGASEATYTVQQSTNFVYLPQKGLVQNARWDGTNWTRIITGCAQWMQLDRVTGQYDLWQAASNTAGSTITWTPAQHSEQTYSTFSDVRKTSCAPSSGLIIGDSTIATYAGGSSIDTFLLRTSDTALGTTIYNQAVPGNTILQQQAILSADANKATYDWIIVQIGLNDLNPAESAETALGRYQTLIDTINAAKKDSAVVVVATMIPCKQRLVDVYGETDGATSYAKWQAMNTSILGGGSDPITGVYYRIGRHTEILNDGSGNLSHAFDTGDGIHENNAARIIIAGVWRDCLNRIGYLSNEDSRINTTTVISSSESAAYPFVIENSNSGVTGFAQLYLKPYGVKGWLLGACGSGSTFFGVPGGLYFYDSEAQQNRMSIDTNGNSIFYEKVGINTANPTVKLHIVTDSVSELGGMIENTITTNLGYAMEMYKPYGSSGWIVGAGGSGETTLGVAGKYFVYHSTDSVPSLVIDPTSNFIGIGDANPISRLTVNGNVTIPHDSGFTINTYYSSGWKYNGDGYGAAINCNAGTGELTLSAFPENSSGSGAAGTPSSVTISTSGVLQASGGYKSSDGTAGLTQTSSWSDGGATNWTMVIKNGLVTSLTHTP